MKLSIDEVAQLHKHRGASWHHVLGWDDETRKQIVATEKLIEARLAWIADELDEVLLRVAEGDIDFAAFVDDVADIVTEVRRGGTTV